jgi:mannose-6-phosphate isomerase-like protein (cupin superfamily)
MEAQLTADPEATVFSLAGTPVLSAGRADTVLARCAGMIVRSKVYAEGGENASHTHANEDHIFFVLGGEATFFLGREGEEQKVVGPLEGILLPRGAYYRFRSTGSVNLVLLRVGAWDGTGQRNRLGPLGDSLEGRDPRNKHVDGVPVPGEYFR